MLATNCISKVHGKRGKFFVKKVILQIKKTAFPPFFFYYSLRKAVTGSFFDAIREGIKPANKLKKKLKTIKIKAIYHWIITLISNPRNAVNKDFAITENSKVNMIPITPEITPMIPASARKT